MADVARLSASVALPPTELPPGANDVSDIEYDDRHLAPSGNAVDDACMGGVVLGDDDNCLAGDEDDDEYEDREACPPRSTSHHVDATAKRPSLRNDGALRGLPWAAVQADGEPSSGTAAAGDGNAGPPRKQNKHAMTTVATERIANVLVCDTNAAVSTTTRAATIPRYSRRRPGAAINARATTDSDCAKAFVRLPAMITPNPKGMRWYIATASAAASRSPRTRAVMP